MLWRLSAVLCLAGCFSKPDAPDNSGDGSIIDGAPVVPLVPRLVGSAYFSGSDEAIANVVGSPGMTGTDWEVTTTGIQPGDLVLFIANADNGSDQMKVFPQPVTAGFTESDQIFIAGDGQCVVVDWKVATAADAMYADAYFHPGSGATVIAVVAISGAASPPLVRIDNDTTSTNPANGTSPGLTPVAGSTLIYAGGADWRDSEARATFAEPTGYTPLLELGDRGNLNFRWTTEEVSYETGAAAAPTGMVMGQTTSSAHVGTGWAALIAVAPK